MSLEKEISQLYSCNISSKTLIEQAQDYLNTDDKTEKSLRNAFINCAAALMSDHELLFNHQPVALLLVELAAKLCQIKPDDREYLQQLCIYLTLSLKEYSSHLDHRLILRALFTKISNHSVAMNSSKQLSITIRPFTKADPTVHSNLPSNTSNTVQQFVVNSTKPQGVVHSSVQQAALQQPNQQMVVQQSAQQLASKNVVQQNVVKNSIPQGIVKNSVQQNSAQQSSPQHTTKSSMQQAIAHKSATQQSAQATAKGSTQKIAINVRPAKKSIETWAVTDALSLKKKPTVH